MKEENNHNALTVDWALINKYNVSGPRYTSYPTALEFQELETNKPVIEHIKQRNRQPHEISLYYHIPFCQSLCWYCGCTKVISRKQGDADSYLDYLDKEMELTAPLLHPDNRVVQMHWGGGTPSFLQPDQIRRLGKSIHHYFTFGQNAEVSVELDPRRLTEEHIRAFKESGFNRASLGIQDTNIEVQKAVNRIQPFEQVERVVQWIREQGFTSLNVDLVYGLPKQTPHRFKKTLDNILSIMPERLAVYSYAHLPRLMPSQKLIDEQDLPTSDQKMSLLKMAIEYLTANGYVYIGMDHFARADEELVEALNNGTLQRNFQGYSTHGEADMYAFGMSGISQPGRMHYQNSKELPTYYEALDNGKLPFIKMRDVSRDDLIRRDAIMKIMCKRALDLDELSEIWSIDARDYFADEMNQLEDMEGDGLVKRAVWGFEVTGSGQLFLRNIAMIFDAYLQKHRKTKNVYSKTV